jgi:hypothetical protein
MTPSLANFIGSLLLNFYCSYPITAALILVSRLDTLDRDEV